MIAKGFMEHEIAVAERGLGQEVDGEELRGLSSPFDASKLPFVGIPSPPR
jgi:hypothetical protein